ANTRRACTGDSVYFYCGNINFSSYHWNFGDGDTSNTRNPFHTYQDSGIYTIILSVTDITGCNINYTLPDPVQVFHPVADFSIGAITSDCRWVVPALI